MRFDLKISNSFLWITVALLIKGLFFWLQVYSSYKETQPLFGYFTHDSAEYYGSMENFYLNGIYSPDIRMPGLGVIFLLFRLFFEKNVVLNIILILQWLVSSVAIYTLSITASRIFKKENVFYFVFFIFILTHYIFLWDNFLLSESFCISFFIFAVYFLQRFLGTARKKYLFFSGLFFTWCVFTRPVFFIFYGTAAIFLVFYFIKEKRGFKTILINGIAFLLLFAVLDSAWIARNLAVKNKFKYLNDIDWYNALNPSSPDPALYFFLESWGGDLENERHWFEIDYKIDYRYRDTVIPSHIYTSQFNKDSLILVKQRIQYYKAHRGDSIVALINNSLMNYTASVKKEKPFLYYIGSGMIYMKRLIFSGYFTYNTFDDSFQKLPLIKKVFKLTRAILFYLLFFIGLIYSVKLLLSKKKNFLLVLLIVIAYSNLIYIAFFFRTPEFRYVLPSTVVFFCLTSFVFAKGWDKLKGRTTSPGQ